MGEAVIGKLIWGTIIVLAALGCWSDIQNLHHNRPLTTQAHAAAQ